MTGDRSLRVLNLVANRWWTGSAEPVVRLSTGLRARGRCVDQGLDLLVTEAGAAIAGHVAAHHAFAQARLERLIDHASVPQRQPQVPIPDPVAERRLGALLAAAEAKIHNKEPDVVTFHESGEVPPPSVRGRVARLEELPGDRWLARSPTKLARFSRTLRRRSSISTAR